MLDEVELFTAQELYDIHQMLLARGFSVAEGKAAFFGQTWHYQRQLTVQWYLRTWIWERQSELILRLGRRDHRGEVGPEHRFASMKAITSHLDESMATLEAWSQRDTELRCPRCGGWLRARDGDAGARLSCAEEDCAGQREPADAIVNY